MVGLISGLPLGGHSGTLAQASVVLQGGSYFQVLT